MQRRMLVNKGKCAKYLIETGCERGAWAGARCARPHSCADRGCRRTMGPRVLALALAVLLTPAAAEILTPPYFNLALGKPITATATCGDEGSELYCKLAGANADQDEHVIQGQEVRCGPERAHHRGRTRRGAYRGAQSPDTIPRDKLRSLPQRGEAPAHLLSQQSNVSAHWRHLSDARQLKRSVQSFGPYTSLTWHVVKGLLSDYVTPSGFYARIHSRSLAYQFVRPARDPARFGRLGQPLCAHVPAAHCCGLLLFTLHGMLAPHRAPPYPSKFYLSPTISL
ncbi:Laminin subunit alpha [Eumeta japonica]|uniref:Laminin subunit alpha n=1 Tax=Eumeta variegata TaxID=151549 RepID=A0A4C2AF42_EUMVA|nr:Laminin subunit alpha [Eumeta japonica]